MTGKLRTQYDTVEFAPSGIPTMWYVSRRGATDPHLGYVESGGTGGFVFRARAWPLRLTCGELGDIAAFMAALKERDRG
jgi:hypothetical protein